MKKRPIPKFLILLIQCLPLAAPSSGSEVREAWVDIASPDTAVWVFRDVWNVLNGEADTFDGVWFGQGDVSGRRQGIPPEAVSTDKGRRYEDGRRHPESGQLWEGMVHHPTVRVIEGDCDPVPVL